MQAIENVFEPSSAGAPPKKLNFDYRMSAAVGGGGGANPFGYDP